MVPTIHVVGGLYGRLLCTIDAYRSFTETSCDRGAVRLILQCGLVHSYWPPLLFKKFQMTSHIYLGRTWPCNSWAVAFWETTLPYPCTQELLFIHAGAVSVPSQRWLLTMPRPKSGLGKEVASGIAVFCSAEVVCRSQSHLRCSCSGWPLGCSSGSSAGHSVGR